jgi:RNA polymerase sigma-70 factor (ECF subfamily)
MAAVREGLTDPAGPDQPDDRRLLADHVAGDPDAFGTLVRRHRDRLWAVAVRTTGDPEEAADALQDALISAFRSAGSYRGEAAVTTWLHRIVVNASLDRIRRRQARPALSIDHHDVAAGGRAGDLSGLSSGRDDVAVTLTRLDVRAALAKLPEPQRVALVLVDLEDLSIAEAAELLGVPEGTVKSRCSRARTALALLLRDSAPGAAASSTGPIGPISPAGPAPASAPGATGGNPVVAGDVEPGGGRAGAPPSRRARRADQDDSLERW